MRARSAFDDDDGVRTRCGLSGECLFSAQPMRDTSRLEVGGIDPGPTPFGQPRGCRNKVALDRDHLRGGVAQLADGIAADFDEGAGGDKPIDLPVKAGQGQA